MRQGVVLLIAGFDCLVVSRVRYTGSSVDSRDLIHNSGSDVEGSGAVGRSYPVYKPRGQVVIGMRGRYRRSGEYVNQCNRAAQSNVTG
jgi:hypothetical protein